MTRMPSARAAFATRTPMAPSPTTPSVRPISSEPTKRFFSFSISSSPPSLGSEAENASASAMLRADRSMPASTSSFTALAFAPGALNTGTPRFDIAAIGMLLVPAPARAIASTESGMSMACMSAERTSTASAPSSASTIRYRSPGNRFRPFCEMLFRVLILYMALSQPLRRAKSRMKSTNASTPAIGMAL